MAATITVENASGGAPSAPGFVTELKVVLDASYPTGGYALDFSTVLSGSQTLVGRPDCQMEVIAGGDPADSNFAAYNATSGKLMVFDLGGTPQETANATNLSTFQVIVKAHAE